MDFNSFLGPLRDTLPRRFLVNEELPSGRTGSVPIHRLFPTAGTPHARLPPNTHTFCHTFISCYYVVKQTLHIKGLFNSAALAYHSYSRGEDWHKPLNDPTFLHQESVCSCAACSSYIPPWLLHLSCVSTMLARHENTWSQSARSKAGL